MARKKKTVKKSKKPILSKKSKAAKSSSDFCSVYITAPSREVALKIAQTLVSEKLAACFNLIENVTSIYTWHNELEKSDEVILIGKTQSRYQEKLIKRAKELHTYEVPCIVCWPITKGFPLYMEWIKANT